MKQIITFMIIAFAVLFLVGCKEPEFPADCGEAAVDDQPDCCEAQNKDSLQIECVGSWKYTDGTGCILTCELDVGDYSDSSSDNSNASTDTQLADQSDNQITNQTGNGTIDVSSEPSDEEAFGENNPEENTSVTDDAEDPSSDSGSRIAPIDIEIS